jgi:hypothetical protein
MNTIKEAQLEKAGAHWRSFRKKFGRNLGL